MAYKKIYDINKTGVNIGVAADAFPVEGLQSVSAERNEDEYTVVVSADGTYRTVRNNNRSGVIVITIASDSPTLQLISALHKQGIQYPIALIDKTSENSSSVAFGDGCTLMRPPIWNKAASPEPIEFRFNAGDLEIWHAGTADE